MGCEEGVDSVPGDHTFKDVPGGAPAGVYQEVRLVDAHSEAGVQLRGLVERRQQTFDTHITFPESMLEPIERAEILGRMLAVESEGRVRFWEGGGSVQSGCDLVFEAEDCAVHFADHIEICGSEFARLKFGVHVCF